MAFARSYDVCLLSRQARSEVSKYLVQWDKEASFLRSVAGGETSHADAADWSAVVVGNSYQVRILLHSAGALTRPRLLFAELRITCHLAHHQRSRFPVRQRRYIDSTSLFDSLVSIAIHEV